MLKTKTRKTTPINKELFEIVDKEYISTPRDSEYFHTSSYLLKDTWRKLPRNWGNALHGMASRSGSFPPSLTDYFIKNYSVIGDLVLDPYSGKGTTAYQACLLDRVGFGVDITPEAYMLTGAKVSGIRHDDAVKYLKSIKFGLSKENIKDVNPDVKVFFSTKTLAQILTIREKLLSDLKFNASSFDYESGSVWHEARLKKQQYAQYWLGILVGILHGSSNYSLSLKCSHSFSMAPGYTRNYAKKHGLKKPDRNVIECMVQKSKLLQSNGVSNVSGKSYLGTAQGLPRAWEEKFDLIVTSPPYFSAQSYAWDNWLREWLLGFDFKTVRKQTTHTSSCEKYSNAMFDFLAEAYRVLKPGKRAFVVVGDVTKKTAAGKIIINTSEIIAERSKEAGFDVDLIINDDIPATRRYNSSYLTSSQGLTIDRIVCLKKD